MARTVQFKCDGCGKEESVGCSSASKPERPAGWILVVPSGERGPLRSEKEVCSAVCVATVLGGHKVHRVEWQ